jgi:hypothetical protein
LAVALAVARANDVHDGPRLGVVDVDRADRFVPRGIERLPDLIDAREAEAAEHLDRFGENMVHALDDDARFHISMAERQLEVVDEGEELLRHVRAFVGPRLLEVAGVTLVRIVEVGHRAPRLVLEDLGEVLELGDSVAVALTVTGVVVALA